MIYLSDKILLDILLEVYPNSSSKDYKIVQTHSGSVAQLVGYNEIINGAENRIKIMKNENKEIHKDDLFIALEHGIGNFTRSRSKQNAEQTNIQLNNNKQKLLKMKNHNENKINENVSETISHFVHLYFILIVDSKDVQKFAFGPSIPLSVDLVKQSLLNGRSKNIIDILNTTDLYDNLCGIKTNDVIKLVYTIAKNFKNN